MAAARRDGLAYGVPALLSIGCTLMLLPASGAYFSRFFGPFHPLLVVSACAVGGAVALRSLRVTAGLAVVRGRSTRRGLVLAALLAVVMGVAIALADVVWRYPRDINVPMPQALLFYPAIALVAEVVFHLAPLALLMAALHRTMGGRVPDRVVVAAMVTVAMTEPIVQVGFDIDSGSGRAAYTGLHVFVIGLLEMAIFRRFDFLSMLAFRLTYYACWHMLWGSLRLGILF